jgi:hypothetical protein
MTEHNAYRAPISRVVDDARPLEFSLLKPVVVATMTAWAMQFLISIVFYVLSLLPFGAFPFALHVWMNILRASAEHLPWNLIVAVTWVMAVVLPLEHVRVRIFSLARQGKAVLCIIAAVLAGTAGSAKQMWIGNVPDVWRLEAVFLLYGLAGAISAAILVGRVPPNTSLERSRDR